MSFLNNYNKAIKKSHSLVFISKFLAIGFFFVYSFSNGQEVPVNFQNPVLQGFGPDPSICRVKDDYYLVTSSFAWFPGIPIYHSKDLVNWKLIGHGITRPEQLEFNGIKDKKGIWAVTIRYHKGLFYLITTCSDCGGNFYVTAKNPTGEWSDPVWLNEAKGIDPSLFWDDDDKCYYTGNYWDFKGSWPGHCAIWGQELDLKQQKLVGDMKVLTSGHANNASHTEAPHIYKIDGEYLLVVAEGGTNMYHSVSVHHSSSVLGSYVADKINPVLTHRHFGEDNPIQAVGHADLVQTQNGDWWAVVLGKRMVDGYIPLSRETFLCKVKMENGTPIFNPGHGKVLLEQKRPDLPWTPIASEPFRDEFESDRLVLKWHTIRTPKEKFYSLNDGKLNMQLGPKVVDSLVNASLLLQPTRHFKFSATTKLSFKASHKNEQVGLIMYRTNESYYMLMKEKNRIVLVKKFDGKKETLAEVPFQETEVYFNVSVNKLDLQFNYGESLDKMNSIGGVQSLVALSENKINKFNGTGIGMYATSNGQKSKNQATFDWFEYKY
jgi:alpha-N-arabinofuranosidase